MHLDLLANPSEEIATARSCGVERFVIPGVASDGWRGLRDLSESQPGVYFAPGLHPQHAQSWRPELAAELERYVAHSRAAAIGEVGLDRKAEAPMWLQEQVLVQMISMACAAGKPLLIHQRGTIGRLLELLRRERADRVGGVFHAYSGSLESAREAIALGFAIGLGGVITFPQAKRVTALVRELPAEWLVLETDAPDMSPHPLRGCGNRPSHLPIVAARLAELRGWSFEETIRLTTANSCRILRLPHGDRATAMKGQNP